MTDEHRGPITHARVGAAVAARSLAHGIVAADTDDETLRAVEALVAQANALLAPAPQLPRALPDLAAFANASLRDHPEEPAIHAMADRAVAGPANPTSVDIVARAVADGAQAEVVFGPAFEGAPGRVHGGMVAAVFDDLLGSAMAQARSPGFTGRLTVHYRAPVPIQQRIAFRAWLGPREGRKLHVHADARLGDRLLATADALFVLVDPEHFATRAQELLRRDGG